MRARIIGPDASDWRELLARATHDVYHQPWYVSASAAAEGGSAAAVFVEDGPDRRLLLPIVMRPIEGDGWDAASPYGYPGPVMTDGTTSFIADAMESAISCLGTHDIVSLFLRLHPLIDSAGVERVGTVVTHGEIVIVDVTQSQDDLWRGTRANHRRDINRSLRAGHVFAFESDDQAYDGFIALYHATMHRLSAADYYRFDDAYFASMREALGASLHLATVRIDDELAAAALFSESCGIVQLHLAGWDARMAHHRPSKLLYHGAISWAHERGARWLNLGGGFSSQADSLLHFKVGFSHETRRYQTLRVVIDENAYRRLVASTGASAHPATMDEYFPAYRSSPDHASPT